MNKHQLPEQDGHVVSYYEYGNSAGLPIIVFHGGPGAKSKPRHTEAFDLAAHRVITFDQRGCGESTPLGELEDNNTHKTLEDTERIREALGIDTWFVSGSSWGSTLALLYAVKHPDKARGLLISGVWLADGDAKEWELTEKGIARLMPDVWEKRVQFLSEFNIDLETQNQGLVKAFESADEETAKRLALGVNDWERNLFSTQDAVRFGGIEDITEEDIAAAKIYVHYDAHHEFIPDNYILDNIATIAHIPAVIVHGRYDILCPLYKAKAVADKLDDCRLVIAASSGHKLTAEGTTIQHMAYEQFLEKHSASLAGSDT